MFDTQLLNDALMTVAFIVSSYQTSRHDGGPGGRMRPAEFTRPGGFTWPDV